jgi:ornithine cyclodeaminase
LDGEAVARARLYTDRRESCIAEAGDFLLARAEGAIGDGHLLGELGDVFIGKLPGRTTDADVTLFKSLGLAVEDLASAHFLLRRAREKGAGTWLEWGGPPSA